MENEETSECRKSTRLRQRPRKRYYLDVNDMEVLDDCLYSYDVLKKMEEERYYTDKGLVKHFDDGRDLSLQYLQTTGFLQPMVFHNSEGLDMKIPSSTFSLADVKHLIGPKRNIDVIDCCSHEDLTMSLDEFCQYFEDSCNGKDERLLNVISLEFSHTPMESLVEAPKVIRELDWVNLVWPSELRAKQKDPTNDMRRMMYPKVQKYCLMSVAGCYTNFHLDFGGTSVWYNILKGEKVFFLIPPTRKNYSLFLCWQKRGAQESIFFPDLVDTCQMVTLKEGDTLLLPSGWIHGVYTPKHSLVFGGNFLHSLNIKRQMDVAYVEKQLKVGNQFRYPFYSQIHWYLVQHYNKCFYDMGISSDEAKDNEWESVPCKKWLKSVSLVKLPIHEISGIHDRQLPYVSPYIREGLTLLIKKMREERLFSSDTPPSIVNPQFLLQSLEGQLRNYTLQLFISQKQSGLDVRDTGALIRNTNSNECQIGFQEGRMCASGKEKVEVIPDMEVVENVETSHMTQQSDHMTQSELDHVTLLSSLMTDINALNREMIHTTNRSSLVHPIITPSSSSFSSSSGLSNMVLCHDHCYSKTKRHPIVQHPHTAPNLFDDILLSFGPDDTKTTPQTPPIHASHMHNPHVFDPTHLSFGQQDTKTTPQTPISMPQCTLDPFDPTHLSFRLQDTKTTPQTPPTSMPQCTLNPFDPTLLSFGQQNVKTTPQVLSINMPQCTLNPFDPTFLSFGLQDTKTTPQTPPISMPQCTLNPFDPTLLSFGQQDTKTTPQVPPINTPQSTPNPFDDTLLLLDLITTENTITTPHVPLIDTPQSTPNLFDPTLLSLGLITPENTITTPQATPIDTSQSTSDQFDPALLSFGPEYIKTRPIDIPQSTPNPFDAAHLSFGPDNTKTTPHAPPINTPQSTHNPFDAAHLSFGPDNTKTTPHAPPINTPQSTPNNPLVSFDNLSSKTITTSVVNHMSFHSPSPLSNSTSVLSTSPSLPPTPQSGSDIQSTSISSESRVSSALVLDHKTMRRRKPRRIRQHGIRKTRCGVCEECVRPSCNKCKFCLDSSKLGGPGKLKKACILRRCHNMVDPVKPSPVEPTSTGDDNTILDTTISPISSVENTMNDIPQTNENTASELAGKHHVNDNASSITDSPMLTSECSTIDTRSMTSTIDSPILISCVDTTNTTIKDSAVFTSANTIGTTIGTTIGPLCTAESDMLECPLYNINDDVKMINPTDVLSGDDKVPTVEVMAMGFVKNMEFSSPEYPSINDSLINLPDNLTFPRSASAISTEDIITHSKHSIVHHTSPKSQILSSPILSSHPSPDIYMSSSSSPLINKDFNLQVTDIDDVI